MKALKWEADAGRLCLREEGNPLVLATVAQVRVKGQPASWRGRISLRGEPEFVCKPTWRAAIEAVQHAVSRSYGDRIWWCQRITESGIYRDVFVPGTNQAWMIDERSFCKIRDCLCPNPVRRQYVALPGPATTKVLAVLDAASMR